MLEKKVALQQSGSGSSSTGEETKENQEVRRMGCPLLEVHGLEAGLGRQRRR